MRPGAQRSLPIEIGRVNEIKWLGCHTSGQTA
jgi:hypothetical protein